jgi:hypothetical protein
VCCFCSGPIPNNVEYRQRIRELHLAVHDGDSFIKKSIIADEHRFGQGIEWAETLQVNQIRLWSRYLAEADSWLHSNAWTNSEIGLRRGKFKPTRCHLLKTIRTLSSPKYRHSFAQWFSRTLLELTVQTSSRNGDIYRFVSLANITRGYECS